MRGILSFLIAAGFLVLTACAGGAGGGGSIGSGGGNGGSGAPSSLEVGLTFTPIANGFVISNQSDFLALGNFTSLNITAKSGGKEISLVVPISAFSDGNHNFTGLDDTLDWKFTFLGVFSDGERQELDIVFVWDENRIDHGKDGIRPGANRDGDGRADSVDNDIDGDGVNNNPDRDRCPAGETGWTSNSMTDYDGDGCRDRDEDDDDDNDNVKDISDDCPTGVTGWTSEPFNDADRDGCRDRDEDENVVQDTDEDSDGYLNSVDIDDDGDGLIEIGTAVQLDAVRYALKGSGRRLSADAELNTTGCGDGDNITSCAGYELVANISLAAYSEGEGWQPLSHDTDDSNDRCDGDAFRGTFEGNGWTISGLNINRSAEDCVGLFGEITTNVTIRNLTLYAESVIGKDRVGSLVGYSLEAQILASFVVVANVSGRDQVGGLAGFSNSTRIVSSSVVVGQVSGRDDVGGLAGDGTFARIFSSSAVVGEVSGRDNIGGLAGYGLHARVYSSSTVVDEVEGSGSNIGGLVGTLGFFSEGRVAYSYVVSDSNIVMLVGEGGGTGVASYWDNLTSGVNSGNLGEAKTSDELRMPTAYEGIYAKWDDDTDIFGDEDEPLAVWCDENLDGTISDDEKDDANRIWNFGGTGDYPAIRCGLLSPADWRNWWSLVGGKPTLNQARLDMLFP